MVYTINCYENYDAAQTYFDERVRARVDEMIQLGLSHIGTDDETNLFCQYSTNQITYDDLYWKLEPDAHMEICNEIVEELIDDAE